MKVELSLYVCRQCVRLQDVETPRNFRQSAHEGGQVESLMHRPPRPPPPPPEIFLVLIFFPRPSRPQGLSATGRITRLENVNHLVGNRTV